MARRIVRTVVQFTVLAALISGLLFVLDLRYRVLPSSIHNFLPEHHAGSVITDIQYKQCTLQLLSSCSMDANKGWIRLNKDVFLGKGLLKKEGYLHVQRRKEEEFDSAAGDRVIVDVKVGRLEPENSGDGEHGAVWEERPGGLWVKTQEKIVDNAITAVDLLFGADAVEVREGWEMKEGSMTVGDQVKVTVRKGAPVTPKRPVVRMNKNHKLKIIQAADIHFSTGVGDCRDAEPASTRATCEADPRTLDFITKILDDEKPDLAVLTGDQVNGDTAPDVQTAIFKFAEPFIKRKIPYAAILGNHDDESTLDRRQIMQIISELPYSLSEAGPELGPLIKDKKGREVREGGAGNYIVEVLAHKTDHSALTLWMLDTHSYSTDPSVKGYDFIKPYQIEWFKDKFDSLKGEHAKYAFMHMDMAFIHIPLPEYRLANVPIFGASIREPPTAPVKNTGFKDALVEKGIPVVSCGHDHVNEYCLLDQEDNVNKIWMCYGGGAGFGGYGGYGGYHRRLRVFEVDGQADSITSWKRLEWDDQGPLDVQKLVVAGNVMPPPVSP